MPKMLFAFIVINKVSKNDYHNTFFERVWDFFMELDFILVHVVRMEFEKGETIGSKCLAINNHAML
jgi:hypothetical protein